MIEINLLPKEYRKKPFSFSLGKSGYYALAGGTAAIVALLMITFLQMQQIKQLDDNMDRARRRAEMLRRDIQLVDALTDVKGKITARVEAVEKLDRNRSVWVRVLEEIAADVPDFVWVTRFTDQGPSALVADSRKARKTDKGAAAQAQDTTAAATKQADPNVRRVEVEGYAFTLNAIAAFMINVMRSDYFDNVEMMYTSETKFDEYSAYNFALSGDLHLLSDEEARRLIAQTSGAVQESQTSHESLN